VAVKSHIQINKALLRNFSTRNNVSGTEEIYYLDLADFVIKSDSIIDVGSKYGYYDDTVENKLNQIECQIGEITKSIKQFGRPNKANLQISPQNAEQIKLYMTNLLIRSEQFRIEVNKTSFYSQFIGGFSSNDIIGAIDIQDYCSYFDKYHVRFIDNVSEIQFALPRNGIYSIYSSDKKPKIILPVTPNRAIALIDADEDRIIFSEGPASYYRIDNNEMVQQFNFQAFLTELSTNSHFVAANRKNRNDPKIVDTVKFSQLGILLALTMACRKE